MFWRGILRKSSIRTTCNLPLQVAKHRNQRRSWLYKVWAPSKNILFDGFQIYTVLTWVRKNSIEPLSSLMFWWGILRKSSIRTTCNLPLHVAKHRNQRRSWLYKVWAPSKIVIFDGAQIYTVLSWGRKNSIEPNDLVRRLTQEFHQNNMQSSVASRKTSEPKKMVTLQSLGPIQKYNFWWAQIYTVLTWVRKNSIGPKVLVRHRAQEFHPNNM